MHCTVVYVMVLAYIDLFILKFSPGDSHSFMALLLQETVASRSKCHPSSSVSVNIDMMYLAAKSMCVYLYVLVYVYVYVCSVYYCYECLVK